MTLGRNRAWCKIGVLAVGLALLGVQTAGAQSGSIVFHEAVKDPLTPGNQIGTWNFGPVVKEQTAVANLAVSLVNYNTSFEDTSRVKFVFEDAANRLVFGTQVNVEFSGDTVSLPLRIDSAGSFPPFFYAYFPSTAPFTVSFRPNSRGQFEDTLTFIFTSPIPDTLRLPIRGRGIGFLKLLNVSGQPADTIALTLDSTRVGDSLPGSGFPITIINTSDNQLGKLSDVVISDPSVFHVVNPQLEIQPGETGILSVQFTPQLLGNATGWGKIVSDDFAVDTPRVNLTGIGTLSLDFFTNDDTVLVEGDDPVHKVIDELRVDTLIAGTANDSLIWVQNRLNQNVEVEVFSWRGAEFKVLSQFGAILNETDTLFAVAGQVSFRDSTYSIGDTIVLGGQRIEVDTATVVPVVLSRTLPLNDSMRVWVRFSPEIRASFADSVAVAYKPFIGSDTKVTGFLPVEGVAVGSGFAWNRTEIDFGPLTPGFTLRDTVQLSNPGQLAVNVSVDTAGIDPVFRLLTEDVFSFLRGQTFDMVWQYTAVDQAAHVDTVRVSSDDPNNPGFDLVLRGGTQAPVILPDVSTLAFGDVVVSDSVSQNLTVRNIGLVTLNVSGVTVSQPAVYTVTPTTFALAPGDSQSVSVQFKPAAPVAYADTLRFASDDPATPLARVALTAGGSNPQYTGDTLLAFGATTLNAGALVDSATICNAGTRGNMVVRVQIKTGASFSLARAEDSLLFVGAGQCRRVAVRFNQTLPAIVWDSLVLTTNDPATDTAYITLSGGGFFKELDWVSGPLTNAAEYQYGKVSVLMPETLVSVMTNLGNDTLHVEEVSLYSGTQGFKRISPSGGALLQQERFDVGVRFAAPGPGLFQDTLLIITDDTTASNDTIIVPLEAVGYVPGLQALSPSLEFDTTEIGTTRLDSVGFTNPGEQAVSISSATLASGTRFSVSGFPASINGDGTGYVKIGFTPLDTVEYADTLTVVTTNPAGTFHIPLSGAGAGGRYADDVDALTFDPVPVFGTAQKSFKVFNAGNRPLQILSIATQTGGAVFNRLSPATLILGAGEEATVTIGFTPQASLAYADTLIISTSDASSAVVRVPVYGETPDPDINFQPGRLVKITEPSLDLGDVPVGDFDAKALTIYNVGLDTLRISAGSLWVATGTPFTFAKGQLNLRKVAPGDSIRPSIRYAPSEKTVDTNYLVIYSNDPDQDTVFVQLTARAVPGQLKLISAATDVNFGTIKVGTQDTSARISIQNTFGGNRVRLSEANFQSPPQDDITILAGIHTVSTQPVYSIFNPANLPTLGRDSIISFRFVYAPADTGSDVDVFRVIGTPDNSGDTLTIPVAGRAAAPSIVLDPMFFDFGTLIVRDTAVRSLNMQIENTGADTLIVDTIVSVNAGAANYNDGVVGAQWFQPFPWRVPPGGSGLFSLAVKVNARKVHYDTLALINNDSFNDPAHVYTRVIGIAPGDVGFVDTVRISGYEQEGQTIVVPVHLAFNEAIKRFSIPLVYTSDVYECVGFDFEGTLLEGVDGLVPTLDTTRNQIALKGNVIFGDFIRPDAFIGTTFARLLFAATPGVTATDSSITFDTAFIPPDVAYGLQDTALQIILPEFVAGRLDVVTSVDEDGVLPGDFELAQNFPNPFNPRTTIEFSVPRASYVSLVVFNLLGQKVHTLIDEVMPPGRYEVDWTGRDDLGQPVSSGIYFYRLSAEDFAETRKMVYMK